MPAPGLQSLPGQLQHVLIERCCQVEAGSCLQGMQIRPHCLHQLQLRRRQPGRVPRALRRLHNVSPCQSHILAEAGQIDKPTPLSPSFPTGSSASRPALVDLAPALELGVDSV